MKKITYIFALLSLTLGLFSCKEEGKDKEPDMLEINTRQLNFEADGGSQTVNISSNLSWSLVYNGSWCHVSPYSGNGNGSIQITVDKNNSTNQRNATISISGGSQSITVDIYQKGSTENNDELPAPTGVTATQNGTSIKISWNSVSKATSYNIGWSENNSDWYYLVQNVTSANCTDNEPANGYNYYMVQSVNGSIKSVWSNVASCNYTSGGGGTKPSVPTSVTAVANSSSSITVSWSSVSNATGYYIYRSSSSAGTYTQIGSSTSTSYSNTGLSANTTYYYKVAAYNNVGTGSQSSSAYATTQSSGTSTPCPPTVSVSGTSTISVSWTVSTSSGCGTPESYEVHKQNPNTASWELKTTTTNRSYSDNSKHPGINRYMIKAINTAGSAVNYGNSSEIPLSAPTGFTASKSGSNVNFSWNKVTGATEYQIFVSTSASGNYTIAKSAVGENTTSTSYYYPATSGTYYFKIKARWMTNYGLPTYVDSPLSSYKSVTF